MKALAFLLIVIHLNVKMAQTQGVCVCVCGACVRWCVCGVNNPVSIGS